MIFVYGERGQPARSPTNEALQAAARGQKQIWEMPTGEHVGGVDAQPMEYERRVVRFFDRTLLEGQRQADGR